MHHFTDRVRCSDGFVREMDAQLAAEFEQKTKRPLSDFVFAPEADMFAVRRNGPVGYVRGSVVGSEYGADVTIAWAHAGGERFVEPHDMVRPGDVRFTWHELPVDEIRDL